MKKQRIEFRSELNCSPQELFRWHMRPGAFQRLMPPWEAIELLREAPVEVGSVSSFRVPIGPFHRLWEARHEAVIEDASFRDVQQTGPFAHWEHDHGFEAHGTGSRLIDRIEFALPGGPLGRLGLGYVRRSLERSFAYRHETTRRDLQRHAAWKGSPLRIAVSGASGLIGGALCALLRTGGHEVIELVRTRQKDRDDQALWSVEHGILEPERLEGLDALVHLAGAGIADQRWTQERKELLRSSRVEATRRLLATLENSVGLPRRVAVASAIGVYGDRGDELLDESSAAGKGFLADLGRDWEAAASTSARAVFLRFGIVVTPNGGALKQMLRPFKLGAGGPIGSGEQWMSWISIDDAIHAILHVLTHDELSGPINLCSPTPVTNRQWSRALATTLSRPGFMPLPAFAARLAFGELADHLLLASQRVAPRVLEASGFEFFDTDLRSTFRRLLGREVLKADSGSARPSPSAPSVA